MVNKTFLSTSEVAKLLGISRVAVFKRIKSGGIKAEKVGRNYVIKEDNLGGTSAIPMTPKVEHLIESTVGLVVKEYGEVLKMLGDE